MLKNLRYFRLCKKKKFAIQSNKNQIYIFRKISNNYYQKKRKKREIIYK